MLTQVLLLTLALIADEDAVAKMLQEKGAKAVPSKRGVIVTVEIGDVSSWTDDEFRQLGELANLKNLSIGPGLTDSNLARLCALPELEVLQTNESRVSDDGVKALLGLKKLRTLKFFHP